MTTRTKGRYRLSDMELDFVSLVAAGDDPLAQVVLSKAAPDSLGTTSADGDASSQSRPNHHLPEGSMGTINKTDLDPEVAAYIDGLESEVDDLTATVTKAEADLVAKDTEIEGLTETLSKSVPKDEQSQEDITKSLLAKADPALRGLIEKQAADLARTTEIAKAERDARLTREFLSKAETTPALPTDKAALASLLRHVAESLTPEDAETLDTVLKSANEAIVKSDLFRSVGTGGGETTISKSVRALAEDIRKNNPLLTIEQAEAQVYTERPDLAEAALNGEDA